MTDPGRVVTVAAVAERCGVTPVTALAAARLAGIRVWVSGGAPCVALTNADRLAAAVGDELQRQRRVATHQLCVHLVAVAQMKGMDIGSRYDPAEVLPGRAITRAVLADAKEVVEYLMGMWEEQEAMAPRVMTDPDFDPWEPRAWYEREVDFAVAEYSRNGLRSEGAELLDAAEALAESDGYAIAAEYIARAREGKPSVHFS